MTRRTLGCILAALLALPLLAGCGSSSGSGSTGSTSAGSGATTTGMAGSGSATIETASARLGTILVDGSGKTVYLFARDTGPRSTCSGQCLANWPAVTTHGKPQAAGGVATARLGVTKRSDGTTQVTYAGHPLYYFAGDNAAGDTNGQAVDAFGANWYVLGTNGTAITSGGGSTTSSGGYGY